jgi:hypothetical protein
MKTCPECGCRVYSLGCTNCNETAYIEEQETLTELLYPLPLGAVSDEVYAVDPVVVEGQEGDTRDA